MKINLFGLHISISTTMLAALKSFGLSEFDKAVIAAKKTELGAAVAAIVKAVDDPSLTGAQKMTAALEQAMPVVLDYAARGGFVGVLTDTEAFARSLIESTLSDIRTTATARVATALLGLFGIR